MLCLYGKLSAASGTRLERSNVASLWHASVVRTSKLLLCSLSSFRVPLAQSKMRDFKDLAYEPLSEKPEDESRLSDASTFVILAKSRSFSYRHILHVVLSILFTVVFIAFGFVAGVKYGERGRPGTPPSDLIWCACDS